MKSLEVNIYIHVFSFYSKFIYLYFPFIYLLLDKINQIDFWMNRFGEKDYLCKHELLKLKRQNSR